MAIDFTAERKEQERIQKREEAKRLKQEAKAAKKEQKLKCKTPRPTWLTHNQTFCLDCEQLISTTTTTCLHCGSSSPHGFLRGITLTTGIFLFLTIGLISAEQYLIGAILLFITLAFFFAYKKTFSEREKQLSDIYAKYESGEIELNTTIDQIIENNDESLLSDETIFITYSDSNGELSERLIDVKMIYQKSGVFYIDAFCHKRQAIRTFRLDRITEPIFSYALKKIVSQEDLLSIFDVKDEPTDSRMNEFEKERSNSSPSHKRHTLTAPSGFKFPEFIYSKTTLVEITDHTDYYEWFLDLLEPEEQNSFSQTDFDYHMDHGILDLEVAPFETMLKPRALKLIGLETPIQGFADFHRELMWKKEDEEPLVWEVTTKTHKQLIKAKLLAPFDIEKTDENLEEYLQSYTVKKLKELCKRFGENVSGPKAQLISRLLPYKDKLEINQFCKPTKNYAALIKKLTKAYLTDIHKQLKDKPAGYDLTIWEMIADDDELLLPEAIKFAESQVEEAEKRWEEFDEARLAIAN